MKTLCLKLFLDHFLRIYSQRWSSCFTQYEHSNDSWYIANLLSQMMEPAFCLQQCMKVKFHCSLACDFSFLPLLFVILYFSRSNPGVLCHYGNLESSFRMSDVWFKFLSQREGRVEMVGCVWFNCALKDKGKSCPLFVELINWRNLVFIWNSCVM